MKFPIEFLNVLKDFEVFNFCHRSFRKRLLRLVPIHPAELKFVHFEWGRNAERMVNGNKWKMSYPTFSYFFNQEIAIISIKIKYPHIKDSNFMNFIICEFIWRKISNSSIVFQEELQWSYFAICSELIFSWISRCWSCDCISLI